MSNSDINTSIGLDLSDYVRDINKAIGLAGKFDDTLDSISNTKLTPIVDIQSGNLDEMQRQMESALNGSYSPKLDIADDGLDQAIKLLADLESSSASVKITANDSDITSINNRIDDFSRTESVKIDVTGDPASDPDITALEAQLKELKLLAVIELGVTLAGSIPTAADIPILGDIVEAAAAAAQLEASLGAGFRPEHAQLSTDVYTGGLAESPADASAKVATTLQMVGNEAGTATFTNEALWDTINNGTYTAINLGAEYQETLLAAKNLVQNGLAPSIESAFDLMNLAQQRGLNMSTDLIETLIEFAPQFKAMGLSGEEAFNVLEVASKNGVVNLNKVSESILEFQVKLAEAVSNPASAPGLVFEKMGLTDELAAYKAGELSGAELARGMVEAAETGLANGTLTTQDMYDLLGSPAEDLTVPVSLEILGAAGGGAFGDTAGIADKVSSLLGTSLDASITTAQRLIETKVAASIDKAFGIQQKIDDFNVGISEFANLVQGGESITGAIEKAFNLTGLEDTINRLESAIGNLVIEFATIGANILEGLGHKDAADDVRGGVRDMAAQQLTFDLKLANNGDDVTNAVDTAIRRGVEASEIDAALTTAGEEFIIAGDLQGARAYIEDLQSLSTITMPTGLSDFMAGRGVDPTNLKAVRAEMDAIMASGNIGDQANLTGIFNSQGIELSEFATQLDYAGTAQTIATELGGQLDTYLFDTFNTMFAEGDYLNGLITALGNGQGDTAGIFGGEILNQFKDLPNQLMTGLADIGGEIPLLTAMQTDLDNTNAKVGEVMPVIGESINANGIAPFDAFSTAINAAAAAMLSQIPIMGEQQAMMQEDLISTSAEMDNFDITAEGLNGISFGGLMNSFAALGKSAADQIGYINEQLLILEGRLGGLSGFSIDIPGIAGDGGSHLYGGVIPGGTVGRVHGNEILAAAPQGVDISVLNAATSSTIENALMGLVGGGAGGGGMTTINNNQQFIYNVQSNAQGFMSDGAARAARGF